MDLEDLATRVAAKTGESAPPLHVLQESVKVLFKELRKGPVTLGNLISVGLAGEEVEPSPPPAPAARGAVPSAAAAKAPPMAPSRVAILVEGESRSSKILAKSLEGPNRAVILCEGAQGLMEAIKSQTIDAVIMDASLEMGDEVRQWLKSDPVRSFTSLIVLYQEGDDPLALNHFRICEDECLAEPYEVEEIQAVLNAEIQRARGERKHFKHEVSFQFPAQIIYQQQAGDFMTKLVESSGLAEASELGLITAFREACDNAIRHGTSIKKDGLITAAYVVDKEKVTVTVEDEGPGFDSSMYIETRVSADAVQVARARHKEGRQGGLGIMLMLKSVDRLEYNQKGNVAKLTQFINKKK